MGQQIFCSNKHFSTFQPNNGDACKFGNMSYFNQVQLNMAYLIYLAW